MEAIHFAVPMVGFPIFVEQGRKNLGAKKDDNLKYTHMVTKLPERYDYCGLPWISIQRTPLNGSVVLEPRNCTNNQPRNCTNNQVLSN